eukprot:scaffold25845_cov112-Isochrysis_galbana.AAC.4
MNNNAYTCTRSGATPRASASRESGNWSRTTAPPPRCPVQLQVPGGVARSIPADMRVDRDQRGPSNAENRANWPRVAA